MNINRDKDFTKVDKVKRNKKKNNKVENEQDIIISIVTPYYNCQKYIEETANSILNQTFPFFEWIIVDDGSSYEGKQKLKQIEKLDNRIKIFENEKYLPNRTVPNEKYLSNRTVPNEKYLSNRTVPSEKRSVPDEKKKRTCSSKRFWNNAICKYI